MPYLGAHMSVAGGLPRAVDRAVLHGCTALQIFTRPSGQWRARALEEAEVEAFRRSIAAAQITAPVAHASYLINLATTRPPLRRQSLAAFGDELDRAEALGLLGVVLHPGAYTDGTEEEGLRLIAEGLGELLAARPGGRSMVLLEQTAGQGTMLGHRFEQLASLIERLGGHPRVGVCLDTCHLLAAGYDLTAREGYAATFETFERLIGLDRLKVVHLNDSKKPCGSRVDRHEHIGRGCLGLEPFRWLLNDPRFAALPMVLETPKGQADVRGAIERDPLDEMNLSTLRSLLATA
ncbi:MAG TPA: deoxyribonuclease IV [Vicinamibacterales bacterium]|nr:deoxyribonuclease IV [Vicinamibacterales bacterium]